MHGCSVGGGMCGCSRGEGSMHGCSRGVCVVAPGGHAWLLPGGHVWLLWGHAWLLQGGMSGCSQGGMHGCSWGVCMVALGGGACVVAPGGMCGCSWGGMHGCWGGRGCAWDTMRYGDMVNEQAVRILLECILVHYLFGNGESANEFGI